MKVKQSLLVLIALFGFSLQATKNHPVRQEIIDEIKLKATSWTPQEIHKNRLRDTHPDDIQKKLGNLGTYQHTFLDKMFKWLPFNSAIKTGMDALGQKYLQQKLSNSNNDQHFRLQSSQDELPLEFDFRTKWPQCLREIRDQDACGACWAFTGSGMLADRICVVTNGTINVELSPQNMVDCSFDNFGCDGGYLMNALSYLMDEGVSTEECHPYKDKTNKCSYKCENKLEPLKKHYCKPGTLKVFTSAPSIKREIMTNGPMMIGLTVYEDFINYFDGDYYQTTGHLVGGHAVKIMGWRTTSKGKTSWLIQNQWNTDWGQNGFGYILEGEVGVDSIAISCLPEMETEQSDKVKQ